MKLRILCSITSLILLALCTGCTSAEPTQALLDIYFLDVGKADCILIHANDEWMIVDSGLYETRDFVVETMRKLGITRISYAVATHPDKDHIGGMSQILRTFNTGVIIEPPLRVNNKPSIDMRQAILDTNTLSKTARAGDSFNVNSLQINILAPGEAALATHDENESSLVLMLTFGNTRILLTGDAQVTSETEMLSTYYPTDLSADLLKVAHHGSNKATTQAFLDAVSPGIAVISTGIRIDGKKLDQLPDPRTLARLELTGARVLRTDIDGTIHVRSNGITISVIKDGE